MVTPPKKKKAKGKSTPPKTDRSTGSVKEVQETRESHLKVIQDLAEQYLAGDLGQEGVAWAKYAEWCAQERVGPWTMAQFRDEWMNIEGIQPDAEPSPEKKIRSETEEEIMDSLLSDFQVQTRAQTDLVYKVY